MIAAVRAALCGLTVAFAAGAQDTIPAPPDPKPLPAWRTPVPFGVGERAEYQVKYGIFSVGRGAMRVLGTDTVRGRETWHVQFTVRGGVPGFRVDDRMESWIDTRSLASLRFHQQLDQGNYERERRFEIHPGSTYVENDLEPQATVDLPLDDGSFLYFIRTIPLEIGREYSFNRYFRPDRNPVRIQVLRKERVRVPAGEFDAVVIRPIIKARGIFSEDGHAEVWLTDDDRRLMVQMKSRMKVGSLNLFLRSYTPPTAAADTAK